MLIAAIAIFAGQIGLPIGIPAEMLLLLAGGYAIHSAPALIEGIVVVTLADVLGSALLFLLVRNGGSRLAARLRRRGAGEDAPWWRRSFDRRGSAAARLVFLIRALPLVRIYAAIGSGLLRARPRDYLLGAVPGGLLWAGTPLTIGFLIRDDVQSLVARYPAGQLAAISAVPGLALIGVSLWSLVRTADRETARVAATATLREARGSVDALVAPATVAFGMTPVPAPVTVRARRIPGDGPRRPVP